MQIASLKIKNFRSLRNVTIPGLTAGNVFHGPNNSGKSNILLALQTIFARKWEAQEVSVAGEAPVRTIRQTQFWYGTSPELAGSFFMDTAEPIEFSLNLRLLPSEVVDLPGADILGSLLTQGHDVRINIAGKIERNGDDGNVILERMQINAHDAFARSAAGISYLPSVSGTPEVKENVVRALLDTFDDCVHVIPSSRYLASESPLGLEPLSLSAANFKNWLHNQSLSRGGYSVFNRIKEWFNEPPFNYGDLSFLRDPSLLEIMVDDGSNYRMPIEAKGTGVQQILILLAFIADSRAKIIAVEEPELNLSFRNQDAVVNKLMSLVHEPNGSPFQLLLTSHSDHVGSRSDLRQYHVSHDGTETSVRRFTATDRSQLFPRLRGKRTHYLV